MRVPDAYVGRTVLNNPHVAEKVVALTFDDGPSPWTTPSVLNALKKYHAHATFFVVGQMASHREALLRRMIAEGHVVGNHSFSHPYHPPEAKAAYELKLTNQIIFKAIGVYPTVFRPPGGVMDSWTARLAKAEGMSSIIWTGSSADTATHDSGVVYSNVIAAAHPGAIILMHDVKTHTAAAVPAILATLSKKGYRFVTVPEMLRLWDSANNQARIRNLAKKTSNGKVIAS
jgi:chitin deacetylase